MRIAIIGSGISGLVCAHLLREQHEIIMFEANDYVGGHTNTVAVQAHDGEHQVDTGFIVFNPKTYPNFCRLLDQLGVPSQPSDMSFGVKCDRTGLEYRGSSLSSFFAQRRNLLRPGHYRMLREILRFFEEAPGLLQGDDLSIGEFLDRRGYSSSFAEHHLFPMTGALWSLPPDEVREFPIRYLVEFMSNHDMLQIRGRPQWRVVQGGSSRYVDALTRPFRKRIHLSTPVRSVRRIENGVRVATDVSGSIDFDHAILATHSNQSLAMLDDATAREREVLGATRYQPNAVRLHTDTSLLPRRQRAWASWNYRIPSSPHDQSSVTYSMNRLQSLDTQDEYLVSLNSNGDVAPEHVIRDLVYEHPVYTRESVAAQARQDEVNQGPISFCGAYWGFGFHEDGVKSALAVCRRFERSLT